MQRKTALCSSQGLMKFFNKTPTKQLSGTQRNLTNHDEMSQKEYIQLKTDFLKRFYDKQRQIQNAFLKLNVLQQRRGKQMQEIRQAAVDQSMEPLKSQNIAESHIKINCIRAGTYIHDGQTMIAADKIAEGAIEKLEQKIRDQHKKNEETVGFYKD